jgi:heme A synthase
MKKLTGLPVSSLAWAALLGNTLVILQGAIVRATGSGAGCGRHWPTCNGHVIPLSHTTESLIEFSHRLLSLIVLILGTYLLYKVRQQREQKPVLFVAGTASFVFLIFEALLGAVTVLFGLTGENTTVARGVMVATHLVNSLLLMGSLSLTVVYARKDAPDAPQIGQQGLLATVLGIGLVGMLVLMFSGGIAAMGNTMFPSESLGQGLAADFDPNSHPLIRLRILHPLIAISVGIYLFLSLGLGWWLKPVPQAKRIAQVLFGVYIAQLAVGTANLAFLAPTVLQILHLALAVVAFCLLTVVSAYALGVSVSPRPVFQPVKEA